MKHVMQNESDMRQQGFTLIELLVTMVVALVILGGLMFSFTQQNSEYNYQNKRIDTYQDLEFGIQFIDDDLRSALVSGASGSTIVIANNVSAPFYTQALQFTVWDASVVAAGNRRAVRCYLYRGNTIAPPQKGTLYYNRNFAGTCDSSTSPSSFNPVLKNVTFFHVFQDNPGNLPVLGTVTPSGAPRGLASASGLDSQNNSVTIPGYTILIEIAVDAGYKNGSFLDVNGVDLSTTADKRKRIWRYIQVHPGTVVQ